MDEVREKPMISLEPASPSESKRVAQIELVISHILRYGVLVSFVIVLIGSLLLAPHTGTGFAVRLNGAPTHHDPVTVIAQALEFDPKSIILFGLMLLIATPVVRVATGVVAFLVEADYTYTLISLFVLVVLITSFALGRAGG